ncbi:hypothetical protein BJ742DRAFT_560209 [Cladochytrium replicatum]|nr:hypothetical protein BJ742DRAFT_560209 [Cladochytrium replicatum]
MERHSEGLDGESEELARRRDGESQWERCACGQSVRGCNMGDHHTICARRRHYCPCEEAEMSYQFGLIPLPKRSSLLLDDNDVFLDGTENSDSTHVIGKETTRTPPNQPLSLKELSGIYIKRTRISQSSTPTCTMIVLTTAFCVVSRPRGMSLSVAVTSLFPSTSRIEMSTRSIHHLCIQPPNRTLCSQITAQCAHMHFRLQLR